MTTKRIARVLAVTAGTGALVAGTAAGASATSVIGFGNSASNNTCTNHGGATPRAATTAGPGAVTGLAAALPSSGPTNQCGDLGIPLQSAYGGSAQGGLGVNVLSGIGILGTGTAGGGG